MRLLFCTFQLSGLTVLKLARDYFMNLQLLSLNSKHKNGEEEFAVTDKSETDDKICVWFEKVQPKVAEFNEEFNLPLSKT